MTWVYSQIISVPAALSCTNKACTDFTYGLFLFHWINSGSAEKWQPVESPGQMAVNNYHQGEPVLNLKQARKLGIKVPADFQREAEQHGTVFK